MLCRLKKTLIQRSLKNRLTSVILLNQTSVIQTPYVITLKDPIPADVGEGIWEMEQTVQVKCDTWEILLVNRSSVIVGIICVYL